MLFAVAHPEDVAALLLIDVAVAYPGRGTAAASSDTPSSSTPQAGAISFLSGGAVARAESYLRWCAY
jgi:pimeloyl-ACP methyl ester carboxylesterase